MPDPGAGTVGVRGRTVLLAGGGSTAGRAVADALARAGARVVVASRSGHPAPDGGASFSCDLTDPASVDHLVTQVHDGVGRLDGLLPLVGGWAGGGGIADRTEAEYRRLEPALTALRLTSAAFWDDLVASPVGRVAIVSSTTVEHPGAGSASYTALKAAAESWVRSLAAGFADARPNEAPRGAATAYRVRSLAGREEELASAVVRLWTTPAAEIPAVTTL